MNSLSSRLADFMENEARSCSMDFGCITPEYVYRMWGGAVAIEEIERAMEALRQAQEPVRRMMLEALRLTGDRFLSEAPKLPDKLHKI